MTRKCCKTLFEKRSSFHVLLQETAPFLFSANAFMGYLKALFSISTGLFYGAIILLLIVLWWRT